MRHEPGVKEDAKNLSLVTGSAIVAGPEVCDIDRRSGGDHELVLRSGARVPLGRSHRADFQQRWRQT